jgi:hypothetical protein
MCLEFGTCWAPRLWWRPLNYGWLPPGRVTDGSSGTSTFSDCINWMGFDELTRRLERIGHPRSAEFRAVAEDYRQCILRGLRQATRRHEPVRLNDGTYVPYVPVQTATRFADRAFKAGYGEQWFVVYMEAYTRWRSAAPWSVLAKSGLLSERERLPTLSLIYVLLPRGYQPQHGKLRLGALGKPTQQIWFREICLWRVKPRSWWKEAPGLMAMYPLCAHGRDQGQAITYAAGCISAGVQDTAIRADLLSTLAIFGKLVYPGMKVLDLIGREKMRESKFFEEVMAEGRIERGREDVLEALQVRYGPEAVAEFKDALAAVNDDQLLSELHRLAIAARRLSEFRRRTESLLTPAGR